jgi:hypothetical protein
MCLEPNSRPATCNPTGCKPNLNPKLKSAESFEVHLWLNRMGALSG